MVKLYLNEFEHFNTTTQSIYELGNFNVLIILTNGVNLTSWDYVENREDILYISEDLFGETNLEGRYKGLKNLRAIVTYGVGNVTSLKDMFSGCESLVDITSLEKWDVSNVDTLRNMFKGCTSLEDISALDNWNVSHVKNMSCMFMGCSSLEDVSALSRWDVGNVEDMHYLFADCTNLKKISALSGWDVGNVNDMGCLFEFCASLEDISALKNWDLSSVFNITALFRGCISLKDVSPLSKWDLQSMTRNKSLLSVFSYCTSLKNLSPLKSWDMSEITRISGLFEGCSSIKSLSALKKWDVSNVTSFEFLFKNCVSLTNISALKSWDISSIYSLKSMFNGCESLDDVSPLNSWDVNNIKSMEGMFKNCSSLEDITCLSRWEISEDTLIDSMFDNCELLKDYPDKIKIEALNNLDCEAETRQKIIDGLDESFFKRHDLNDFDENIQLNIVELLSNQSLLAFIVDRSQYKTVQKQAIDKVNDAKVLASIARNDHNYDIYTSQNGGNDYKFYFYNREIAFLKIRDKKLLINIVKEMEQVLYQLNHICEFISSEKDWADIVLNSKSLEIRYFALKQIESEDVLKQIADESDDEEILVKILDKLKKE